MVLPTQYSTYIKGTGGCKFALLCYKLLCNEQLPIKEVSTNASWGLM